MQDRRDYHYLVHIVYRPRILVYTLAVLITVSGFLSGHRSQPVALFCLFLMLYPHLAFRITGHFFDGAASARYSLLIDAVLVGLLILANRLQLLPSVSFFAALVMSTLVVSGTAVLAANVVIVLLTVSVGLAASHMSFSPAGETLTDLLSAIAIILYSGLVGHIGFRETVSLMDRSARMNERTGRLAHMAHRLSKYVSPQIYSSLVAGTGESPIVTSRKRLTVFFSDIEGFTRLMDTLDEAFMTAMLNEYLDDMAAIALTHGGTVDKFMGDGVMVFFGDPVSRGSGEDALWCVRMALAMRERLQYLREKWHWDIHIRIGIHTGYCAVGNFGSEHRMDYTIIGGAVNLASRLERQAGRDEILMSADTWRLVSRDIDCVRKPAVHVKGIARPVDIYSVIGARKSEPAVARGAVIRLLR